MQSKIYRKKFLIVCLLATLSACDNHESDRAAAITEGTQLFKSGDYQNAKAAFEKAVAIEPKNVDAKLAIAEAMSHIGDMQDAVNIYQDIIIEDPKNLSARIKLGHILLLAAKIPEAEKLVKEALAINADDIDANSLWASVLSAQNNTDAAIVKAEQIHNTNPENISATLLLASLNAKIGQIDKAKSLLQNCIDKNKLEIEPRLLLANLLMQTGAVDKAQELLASIIAIEPQQLIHRQRLAMFFINSKQLDSAEEILRQAVKDLSEDESAKLLLVDFLASKRTPEVAIAELIPMIEEKPENFNLRFKLADLQSLQKQDADVEEILKETIKLAKDTPQVLIARNKLAQLYITKARINDAKLLINTNLSEQAKNVDALILKAELTLLDNKVEQAIVELRDILVIQPDNIRALKLLSKAHRLANNALLATENLLKVLDIDPKDELSRIELVDLLLKTGNAKQAEQQLNTLFKINPNSKNGLEALFKIYIEQKQWQQALQITKQIQSIYSNDALGYYLEGLSYQAEGKFDKSIEPLNLALQKQADAIEPLSQLITGFLALKQSDKAISKLNDVIKKQPNNAFAYNLLGSVYTQTNQYAQALDAYQQALKINSAWAKPYRNIAVINQLQKKSEDAVAILTKGIQNCTDNSELLTELVNVYHSQGHYNKVIALYEKIHQQRPDSLAIVNELVAYITAYGKDKSEVALAVQLIPSLIESNNPFLIDTAAWFYYQQGQYNEARQALLKAQSLNADIVSNLYHLGMTYFKLADYQQAKQYLQKALDKKVDFSGLKEAKETLKSIEEKH